MFTLNLGYYLNYHSNFNELSGVVQLVGGSYSHRVVGGADYHRVLIDPQLYLATLNVQDCAKSCAKLSTYPWFQTQNVPLRGDFEKIKEWQAAVDLNAATAWTGTGPGDVGQAVRDSINFQLENNCTHIILPSPLIVNREDEGAIQAEWLDRAIEYINEIEPVQPLLATIAIDEGVIDEAAFAPQGYLDALLDQYSAREEVNGVYIVVNQTYAKNPFATSKLVNKTYLHLSKLFSEAGYDNIFVNFADIFGAVCVGFGATAFMTGQSQGVRRLSLQGFEDGGGGTALPHYYSHKSISEYLSEEELDKLIRKNLYRRVVDDTAHSLDLTRMISRGGNASNIGQWAESKSNVSASNKHFITRMIRLGQDLLNHSSTPEDVRSWIEDADANQTYLKSRIDPSYPNRSANVTEWLELIDLYI